MTWFIIFVSLLGVQFAYGISENVTVSEGSQLRLKTNEIKDLFKCEVKANNGMEYLYKPAYRYIRNRIWADSTFSRTTCSVTIRPAELEDAGDWIITSYWPDTTQPKENGTNYKKLLSEKHNFKVHPTKKHEIVPTDDIVVYRGLYVHAKLDGKLGKVDTCTATNSKGDTLDLLSTHGDDLHLFGQCGFQMRVNDSHDDTWTIKAVVNELETHYGDLRIRVVSERDDREPMKYYNFELGAKGEISLAPTAVFCQLKDPRGTLSPLTYGSCKHRIPVVTSHHDGVWTASYGVRGSLDLIRAPFIVSTHKSQTFSTTVTAIEDNKIKLLCHMHISTPKMFEFCFFTRPDGVILNMSPGIGTKEYSTFNITSTRTKRTDMYCGLIIHKPEEHDYGTWKCGMGSEYQKFYTGSFLYVSNETSNDSATNEEQNSVVLNVEAKDVFVKHGDSFVIKCSVNAALDYCWFRSPNGTVYTVAHSEDFESPSNLPYVGSGLSLGECGARIEHAVFTDNGEWTCNLGIANSLEERASFSTHVEESYLVPTAKVITIYKGFNPYLSCDILQNVEDMEIRYCRWIRPDGYGIYTYENGRYVTSASSTQCKLLILGEYTQEELGNWTCVAGVTGTKYEEISTHIIVQNGYQTSTLFIASLVVGSVAVIAIVYGIIITLIRRKLKSLPKMPPSFNPNPQSPPKPFNP